jgi:predicted AAA+ superfamily ATPase
MRNLIRQKIADSLAAPLPELIRRDIRLPRVRGKAIAVIGMRRSGKTCFLWQLLGDRLALGTGREGLLYFGFEDERLAEMKAADLHLVVEEYYRLHPEWRDKKKAAFFLDEIQVVPGWEVFVRRLLDTEKVELFLSGSSSRLLSREVATSMRGRALSALVHPFSFREYLRYLGREPQTPPGSLPKAARSALEKDLDSYLASGGFPETLGASLPDRTDLLKSYVDTALLRDVVERHNVSQPTVLRWMMRHLLANAAGSFSIRKFYGDIRSQGFSVSKDTLHQYLGHLEDAFLIRTVSMASASERRRMVNPRKVYPVDPGLIPLYEQSGRPNAGHALETVIMLELERRGAEVSYVRTLNGLEVDFLARHPDGKSGLIQVCADTGPAETLAREVRALLDAEKEHRNATLHLVGLNPDPPQGLPKSIQWQPASQWLLG